MEQIQAFLAWGKSGWSLGKVGQSSRRSEVCNVSLFDIDLNAKRLLLQKNKSSWFQPVLGWNNCQQMPFWQLLYHAGSYDPDGFSASSTLEMQDLDLWAPKLPVLGRVWACLQTLGYCRLLPFRHLNSTLPSFWESSWGVEAASSQRGAQTCCAWTWCAPRSVIQRIPASFEALYWLHA